MKTYKFVIPCQWVVAGEFKVQASSLEEALKIADDGPLPEGEYVDNSFEINDGCIDDMNRGTLECIKIDTAPLKELPLLIGTLKTKTGQARLEERMKGD